MQFFDFGRYEIIVSEIYDFDSEKKYYPKLKDNIIRCKQIHSNIVNEYNENWKIDTIGDGIFSNIENLNLGIGVSDCNAVVILGDERFGVLHAGWKGLRDGIIEKMILEIKKKDKSSLQIFVGPSIRSCCYQVGNEFLDYFDKKYFTLNLDGTYYFDMIHVIKDICKKHGIKKIIIHTSCTKCSKNFFSYRRKSGINNLIVVNKKY